MIAVDKAEDGANFLEVFEWFRTEGYDEQECFDMTKRTFRGGVIEGGRPLRRSAVDLVRAKYPRIPVIVVSGALSDESAVELIKAGAR